MPSRVAEALKRGLLAEADLDAALRGLFRVSLRLGLLDPPERVPYSSHRRGRRPRAVGQARDARVRPRGHAQVNRAPQELGRIAAD